MTIIKCPECGGQVSNLAKACPHCGFVLSAIPTIPPTGPATKKKKGGPFKPGLGLGCLIIIGIVFIMPFTLLICTSILGDLSPTEPSSKRQSESVTGSAEPKEIEDSPIEGDQYVIGEKGKVYFNSEGKKVVPDLVYEIYDEQIYDAPIKTSITQHITVEGKYDESAIRKVLVDNFEKAKKRRGFEYHNPATHYQIIVYPKNDSRWVGLLNKILDQKVEVLTNNDLILSIQEVEVLTNNDLILSIQEGDSPLVKKYGLNELNKFISQYDLHEVEIITKNPLHIRVSKEVFIFDFDEVKLFYSKENYVEALMAIMLHTNLDNFQLTARPIKCDFKKDKNGKVVIGQGLKYLGYYSELETSRFIKREKINQFLKKELGISSINELAVDGYFYNHKLYIEMLYNDQGGITLDRTYNLLTKVYASRR